MRKALFFIVAVALVTVAVATPAAAILTPQNSCECWYQGPDGDAHSGGRVVPSMGADACYNRCMAGWTTGSKADTCQETAIGTVCGGSSSISNQAGQACSATTWLICPN